MTRSEPWALALRAFCCIQIRTETFTSPAQRGKKAGVSQLGAAQSGFSPLFSKTMQWDNWCCRWLILICFHTGSGESQYHVCQWLVLPGHFRQLLSSHASRECPQGEALSSCSVVWVGWRLGKGGFMCCVSHQDTAWENYVCRQHNLTWDMVYFSYIP